MIDIEFVRRAFYTLAQWSHPDGCSDIPEIASGIGLGIGLAMTHPEYARAIWEALIATKPPDIDLISDYDALVTALPIR